MFCSSSEGVCREGLLGAILFRAWPLILTADAQRRGWMRRVFTMWIGTKEVLGISRWSCRLGFSCPHCGSTLQFVVASEQKSSLPPGKTSGQISNISIPTSTVLKLRGTYLTSRLAAAALEVQFRCCKPTRPDELIENQVGTVCCQQRYLILMQFIAARN